MECRSILGSGERGRGTRERGETREMGRWVDLSTLGFSVNFRNALGRGRGCVCVISDKILDVEESFIKIRSSFIENRYCLLIFLEKY